MAQYLANLFSGFRENTMFSMHSGQLSLPGKSVFPLIKLKLLFLHSRVQNADSNLWEIYRRVRKYMMITRIIRQKSEKRLRRLQNNIPKKRSFVYFNPIPIPGLNHFLMNFLGFL